MTSKNNTTSENKYFNLHVNGIGYLSNIRQVNGPKGQFLTAVINALSGPADNPVYVRFDTTVVGENTVSLVRRCIKAVDEDKKVLTGFTLSNLASDIFTLTKGEHAGEQRVSLKARLLLTGLKSVKKWYIKPRNTSQHHQRLNSRYPESMWLILFSH